jgi:hypothetical protein
VDGVVRLWNQRARQDPGCDDGAEIVREIIEQRAEATGGVKQPGRDAVQAVGNRADRDVHRSVGQPPIARGNKCRGAEHDPEARDRLGYQGAHARGLSHAKWEAMSNVIRWGTVVMDRCLGDYYRLLESRGATASSITRSVT